MSATEIFITYRNEKYYLPLNLLFSAGWVISDPQKSCDHACESQGLECVEENLEAHHDEVDSSNEVISLLKDLGISISAEACTNKQDHFLFGKGYTNPVYGKNTNDTKDFCFFAGARNSTSFNCSQPGLPLEKNKQRICWCSKPGKIRNNPRKKDFIHLVYHYVCT